jgi:RNA polymerase sigma factor (sigma-70 family)
LQLEQDIWLRVSQEDKDAYAEIYRILYRRLYNYGGKFSSDVPMIEDSVQEALLLIWEKRHTLMTVHHKTAYFYSAFRNILFTKLKHQKIILSDDEIVEEPVFSVDQILIDDEVNAELKAQLQKALASLTTRQREAIFLRFYEGLSYENVAEILGISIKATYKIMARALSGLKEQFNLAGTILGPWIIYFIPSKYFLNNLG